MCMECVKKGTKRLVGSTTDAEYKSFMILLNRKQCCEVAARPGAIPDGVDESDAAAYVKRAIADKAEALYLFEKWFRDVADRTGVKSHWDLEMDESSRADNLFMPIGVE